ncbi:MAG: hypothetical protein QOG75_2143 [Mycobacterium sp.]|nr:hypothetical protein [Mycobacterium sp.]
MVTATSQRDGWIGLGFGPSTAPSDPRRYVQLVSTRPAVALDLPAYRSQHLKRSPLVLVAAQANFEEVGQLSHGQARNVQKKLDDKQWTTLQPATQVQFALTPSGPIQATQQAYRVQTSDGNWTLSLNPDSVTLETTSYAGWDDFLERFSAIAAAVTEVFDPSQCLRLGLRYIDQIPLPDGKDSWEGLINDFVRGLVDAPTFGSSILGADQRHLLQLAGGARCMFHQGLLADEHSQLASNTYLLDYDVFIETPRPYDPTDIATQAATLHDHVGALFRASIEDELFSWLKGDE